MQEIVEDAKAQIAALPAAERAKGADRQLEKLSQQAEKLPERQQKQTDKTNCL